MLEALLKKLGAGRAKLDGVEAFVRLLWAGADEAMLAALPAGSIEGIAQAAYGFVGEKPLCDHKIRFRQLAGEGANGRATTLIEILNDDMPFLVDSVMAAVTARDNGVQMVLHPILEIARDSRGNLEAIGGMGDRHGRSGRESFIQIYLDGISEEAAQHLVAEISEVLGEVRESVADWKPMLARLEQLIAGYRASPPKLADNELAESIAFLRWLADGNFTFLGMRQLDLVGTPETGDLVTQQERGLGILRNPAVRVLRRGTEPVQLTPEVRRFFFQPAALIVTKANAVARVHRRIHMDYVGAKIYGADGQIAGELRIVGLFTSAAYNRSVAAIPLVRHKVAQVIAASGFAPDSHDGKAIQNILENFPRDEMFQIGVAELGRTAAGILDLELRPRTRAFTRTDEFDRFVSVLVYLSRDRFSTEVRERIGAYLARVYDGRVSAFYPNFTSGPQVRVHFIIGRYAGPTPKVEQGVIEAEIRQIVTSWQDRLGQALKAGGSVAGGGDPSLLLQRYNGAFSAGFRETFTPARAIQDIGRIEQLSDEQPIAIDFYRDEGAPEGRVRVALYRLGGPIPLSERVPVFENLGFKVIDERSYRIEPQIGGELRDVRLHDMMLETADGAGVVLGKDDLRLEQCFLAVMRRDADNDAFNRLVKAVGCEWRDAALVRAYGGYLRQLRLPISRELMAATLVRHAAVAADLIALFRARFDPDNGHEAAQRESRVGELKGRIETALQGVQSLDEDRVLRHYLNLVLSTLRTNFFQHEESGRPPPQIAFKLRSGLVDGMPEPRPFAEIWVYSPRVEGVHMRFAPIARGGLRWSDRAQDFRTEVLGLVKAQQVKNTVIVPQGAKGGFLPKWLPAPSDREAYMKEGIAAYEQFVSTLLDLTDNIVEGAIVPPLRVVRHDGDDPYLVVAADKGTATFSDFANAISARHDFWLGDAFASGGSAGYDHKKMAITARGGWECVKRHFREIDVDIQKMPFQVIGVGDMSGDVFGNAMLLSPTIRLVAAFDHRDIFIDPDPDPASSLAERQRLFALSRSSWQDYDKGKLSAGGGIFARSAKSIPLSPELRALVGVDRGSLAPMELMNAILKAPADLLWFGGIGTYVKASSETDEQVGDRANDQIRVTGAELRAKVIGEGANLGLTQRGRIEFGRRGGRINTDFIDNSAGVNSSDQEVNIKIAFGPALAAGKLDIAARNAVLVSMTDDVARACLRNNYQQGLALSLGQSRGLADLGFQQRLIRALEDDKLLDRQIEALPSDTQIDERMKAGEPLTRAELAVLLSYAKIALSRELLASTVPDDPYLSASLADYFPERMRREFRPEIEGHKLRREIIATQLTNAVINRGGSTMVVRLEEETGHSAASIVGAFAAVSAIYRLDGTWARIDALDNAVPGAVQLELYREVQDLVRRQTAWCLRKARLADGLSKVVERFRPGVEAYRASLASSLTPRQRSRLDTAKARLEAAGVPAALAVEVASLDWAAEGPGVAVVAEVAGRPIADVARIHAEVGDHFRLSDLRASAEMLPVTDYFERLAINSTLSILSDAQRSITEDVIRSANGGEATLAGWLDRHGQAAARAKAGLDETIDSGQATLARLSVAAAQVRELVVG